MPHYADGTPAKLGDLVKGKPYNTPHEVTGVVVGIIPDTESCNVRVAFARPPFAGESHPHTRKVSGYDADRSASQDVVLDVDYGETRAFEKVLPDK